MMKSNDMLVPEKGPARLTYRHNQFVDRDLEIELILDKVRRISAGEALRSRTVVITGRLGVGKTWLLRELEQRLENMPGVQTLYLDLLQFPESVALLDEIEKRLHEYSEPAISQSDTSVVDSPTSPPPPEVRVSWLLDDWEATSRVRAQVLLLDSVYEAGSELLEELEAQVLALLAAKWDTLIVMAGRGRAHIWKTAQLRLFTEEIYLKPFNDPEFTKELLQLQQPLAESRADEIHDLSGGYPLGIYLLAATLDDGAALEQAVSALLDGVSSSVRKWVEALCVLNGFDEDSMPALLATYYDDPAWRDRPFKEMRSVRDGLLRARLANWDESLGGWVIDAAVRKVVEEHLKRAQPEKWQALHRAAYCLFNEWQRQYLSERERWREQTDYHKKCLQDAGADLPECEDTREDHEKSPAEAPSAV